MSTDVSSSEERERQRRHEARGGRHSGLGCRPREGILRWSRVAARRRLPFDNGFRVVQFTPPGSGCSVQFGTKMTSATPGSAHGNYLIVSDAGAAREDLMAHGVTPSEVFYPGEPGAQFQSNGSSGRVNGSAPDHASYSTFVTFSDPDGNDWLLQEITTRLPGRIDAAETSFASGADLEGALRRAAAAHGEHEKRTGEADENWPEWYAAYMVAEQAGTELPT